MKRQVGALMGGARWRRWPLVGVFLVVAVVGHAASMAGGVHAATPPIHHPTPHAPVVHAAVPDSVAARTGAEAMRGDCGTDQAVAPGGADGGFSGPAAAVPVDALSDLATMLPAGRTAPPPTLPPRVRRALLQVFRI